MTIRRRHVISLCAMAWKLTPDEIEARVADGRLGMQQLMSGAMMQIVAFPLTGSDALNLVFPWRDEALKAKKRQQEIAKDNDSVIQAALAARRKKGVRK